MRPANKDNGHVRQTHDIDKGSNMIWCRSGLPSVSPCQHFMHCCCVGSFSRDIIYKLPACREIIDLRRDHNDY